MVVKIDWCDTCDSKKQHRCWRGRACTGVHLRVYVRGRLRVCVRVYASGGVTQLLCFYLVVCKVDISIIVFQKKKCRFSLYFSLFSVISTHILIGGNDEVGEI